MRAVRRLLIVHTNDIHGRVEALARAASVIERVRAENPDAATLYVDGGDVEETTSRLSNLTKGAAMHRLLNAAGCRAVAVGNGAVMRYGVEVLPELAAAAPYPHLAANLFRDGRLVEGVHATTLLDLDGIRVGLIGLTPTDWSRIYEGIFGCTRPPADEVVREHAPRLRVQGADVVIVLSHLGLAEDRDLAAAAGDQFDLVVGSHSHNLLPEGERVGDVTIAQAGEYGEHVGVVELVVGEGHVEVVSARVVEVGDVPPHPGVAAEVAAIERQLEESLAAVVGELADELELADDHECAAANFMADVIRDRMRGEVGLITSAVAFDATLPAGPLTRRALYDACSSPGVSGATDLTGAQLRELVAKGLDPELARDTPRSFRGRARGLLHVSGAEVREGELLVAGKPLDPARTYRVAGSDWELDAFGGYADSGWGLQIEYDMPHILREAVEDHLRRAGPVTAPAPRVHGALAA
jgi:2',3'-cyclic-nucleotide 2'-phosphodiesterase (5'-nucleotidase family)